MLYLACTTISSVDLAQYGVSLAKDWVSVKCGTKGWYGPTVHTQKKMQKFKKKKKKKKKKRSWVSK